jgi:PAS domain S-box-containing protein
MELAVSRVHLGARVLYVVIMRDITDRRRAEERLRQAASVFENTTEGIIITEPDGVILSVNPAFTSITGYSTEEALGQTPRLLQSGRQDKAFYRRMWESLLNEGHWQGEIWNRRKSGEVYPQWLNITAIRDAQGRVINYVGITWDISELKASERMKDEFISTVSHELRTPLTSIRGSLGLVMGGVAGEIPDRARNMVQIAHDNCQRLVRLINDILDFQKIEAGKMSFSVEPLDLVGLVQAAITENQAYADQMGVRLAIDAPVGYAWVVGDRDRLMQVMANLLSNAVKFSPEGEAVTVSVERRDSAVRVTVADRGPGVPEAFRRNLFRKFAQADASDSRQRGGTGLGLHICKLIVEHLDGDIGYTAQHGTGSSFYFELPELRRGERPPGDGEPAAADRLVRDAG